MNVFTNVWKNPYTYATTINRSIAAYEEEICHKILFSKKTDKKKKQNELFVIIYFHIFDENLKIVSNYE